MVRKKPHRPWTIEHYVNGQPCFEQLHDLGKASRLQRYFRCLCGEHFTYRTVKAVNDDPRALMCPHVECLACDCSPYLACSCENNAYESPKAKADALWALGLHVQTALELHCGRLLRPYAGDVVLAEAQCLDLHRLPHSARQTVSHVMIDFYIIGVDLLIMVDGEHHFKNNCYARTVANQGASDQRFDAAVLAANRRLLRLHYLDITAWPAAIAQAVAQARQGDDDASWIEYTASYSEERRVTQHDIEMHIGREAPRQDGQ